MCVYIYARANSANPPEETKEKQRERGKKVVSLWGELCFRAGENPLSQRFVGKRRREQEATARRREAPAGQEAEPCGGAFSRHIVTQLPSPHRLTTAAAPTTITTTAPLLPFHTHTQTPHVIIYGKNITNLPVFMETTGR